MLPWFRIVGGAGMRIARLRREEVDGLAVHLAVETASRRGSSGPANRRFSPRGLTTAPESRCDPGCFPFSSTATGTSPRRSAVSGSSSRSCPSRIAQASPAGPAPTTRTPTSIGSESLGTPSASSTRHGGGNLGRDGAHQAVPRPDQLGQLGDDLVEVADDAEVGELEDRRVRVLVDRDDHVRALHADLVLDRAGDPAGDVELRRDALPGLPDLRRVRVPARVDDGARRGDRAAERLGEVLDEREVLRPAEAATAGDDHVRVLDRRARLLLVRLLEHRRAAREVLELDSGLDDLRLAARRDRLERARADERELRRRSSSRRRRRPSRRAPAACRPGGRPRGSRSTRSQFRPASSRAASPAATSAASTDAANRTVS